MECGLVGNRELVGSHGQAAPLLEADDASFDRVALLVRLGVESGRSAAGPASAEAVADLVGGLRDDGEYHSPAKVAPDRMG
jgi:hypothetical protein